MRYLLALLLLTACQVQLHEDPIPISAKDAGYPTAEIVVNGKLYSGAATVSAVAGSRWDDLDLKIQGYADGTVYVVSPECGVEYSVVYKSNQLVKIPLSGVVGRSCLFGIVVGLQLPDEQPNGIRVYPLEGWVAVKALGSKDDEWLGMSKKGVTSQWTIRTGDTHPVKLVMNGCGMSLKQPLVPSGGLVKIPLLPTDTPKCVLDGAILSKDFANLYLTALLINYNSLYLPLPIPNLATKGSKLTVTMDSSVSLMALDTDYVFDNVHSWTFDSTKTHILRGATVKGRVIIGVYEKGAWKWVQ